MSLVPKRAALGAPFVVLALAASAIAQEPATPPPATSGKMDGGAAPPELLPDIGRLGSEVGILGGASWNPYEVGRGFHLGGFLLVDEVRHLTVWRRVLGLKIY